MAETTTIRAEDVLPVRSRISWGAVFAGAMVALALYVLLSLLGAAAGFSVSNHYRADQLSTGAAIWAVFSLLVSLFCGGCVTSQFTVGENKYEAAIYGVILWGVMFTALMWLVSANVRLGYGAMVGLAAAQNRPGEPWTAADIERAGERAGLTREQIDRLKEGLPRTPEDWNRVANDPEVRSAATRAAWWSFGGALLSLLAAVGGAVAGAGPTLRLRRFVYPGGVRSEPVVTAAPR
jgi:hypothetical protein